MCERSVCPQLNTWRLCGSLRLDCTKQTRTVSCLCLVNPFFRKIKFNHVNNKNRYLILERIGSRWKAKFYEIFSEFFIKQTVTSLSFFNSSLIGEVVLFARLGVGRPSDPCFISCIYKVLSPFYPVHTGSGSHPTSFPDPMFIGPCIIVIVEE